MNHSGHRMSSTGAQGRNDTDILRTIGYAHPVALHIHVQTVVSTTYFASMGTLLQTARKRSVVQDVGLYAGHRNMVGVVGFGGDYPSPADLETFVLKRRTDADDATFNFSCGSTACRWRKEMEIWE
ncbi:hypothetical protein EDB89DRAFT_2062915 [Lactarius sanguifluus]|nr:hypothetical protein EDB89DRAFT_2062915 [Lactarius sanguifluus]